MVQLSGIYNNGSVILDEPVDTKGPVKVLVTFLDDNVPSENKRLTINDLSFLKGRDILKDLKSSLSDAVIEERRGDGL